MPRFNELDTRTPGHYRERAQRLRDEADTESMTSVLRDAGFSIRQIGGFLGYKSPRSVVLALGNGKK